jgi:acetyl-CoA carboxylase biotin carboxyl carrier protein
MKLKEIEELINFINQSGLEEVNIETDQIKLNIKRSKTILQQSVATTFEPSLPVSRTPVGALQEVMSAGYTPQASQEPVSTENYVTIKSPMIGTFYRSANPDAASFVEEGQKISQNQTVCIIEAMKLFNEIESDVAGTIVKILVEDASPVEYDQPLFLVKPA